MEVSINWGKLAGDFLTQILPVLIAFIGSLVALWKLWLEQHIKDSKFKKAILYATNLIEAEVGRAESIAVKAAKTIAADGKLTAEKGAEIKNDVLVLINKQIPADVYASLQSVIPDVTSWIDAQLQKAVQSWSTKDPMHIEVAGGA